MGQRITLNSEIQKQWYEISVIRFVLPYSYLKHVTGFVSAALIVW